MMLLSLFFLLLSVGTAQAGEHVWSSVPPGCKLFQKHDYAKVEMICDGGSLVETKEIIRCNESGQFCEVYDPSKFPCYKRMQELIRSVDVVLDGRVDWPTWEAVMRECVK